MKFLSPGDKNFEIHSHFIISFSCNNYSMFYIHQNNSTINSDNDEASLSINLQINQNLENIVNADHRILQARSLEHDFNKNQIAADAKMARSFQVKEKTNNNSNDGTGGVQENSDHETDGDQNDTENGRDDQDASKVGRIDVAQNTNHIIQGKRLPMLLPKEMTHKTIKNFIKNPFLLTQQERKPTTK